MCPRMELQSQGGKKIQWRKSLFNKWASLEAQTVKNQPAMQETQVQSRVGKIAWRRKQLPTAVCLPEYKWCWENRTATCERMKWEHFLTTCCRCSVTKSRPALSDSMDCSMPGFLVLHYLPEFAQTHVRWVGEVKWSCSVVSNSLRQHGL